MFYSYQDCWNYAFSNRKFELEVDLQRDLITICQTTIAEFWFNFTRCLLTKNIYLRICHKIDKYCLARYPAAFLSRKVGFYQSIFRVEKGVFIPQKATETLVEKLLELVNKK